MEGSFELVITGMEHHTWQGVLRGGGEEVPFRSELELLLTLDRLLPQGQGAPAEEGGTDRWRPD